MGKRIYVASSWRNTFQPNIVSLLRSHGHHVYDFKNPRNNTDGFRWTELDQNWENWTAEQYRDNLLLNKTASHGFICDFRAMLWADICVLVLPCGRSAHLEAGWFCGANKRCIIYTRDGEEPELMALLANEIVINEKELLDAVAQ